MRDPERIARICGKLAALWAAQPESRLGQLVVNLAPNATSDPFHVEDDVYEREIDAMLVRMGLEVDAAARADSPGPR